MKRRQKLLTDEQWELIEPLFPKPRRRRDRRGRPVNFQVPTRAANTLCISLGRDRSSMSSNAVGLGPFDGSLGAAAEACAAERITNSHSRIAMVAKVFM